MNHVAAFKALSDDTRLEILKMLAAKSMCANEILQFFDISQSTLSYHMKSLAESRLVTIVKDGVWVRYSLNGSVFRELSLFLMETAGLDRSGLHRNGPVRNKKMDEHLL